MAWWTDVLKRDKTTWYVEGVNIIACPMSNCGVYENGCEGLGHD